MGERGLCRPEMRLFDCCFGCCCCCVIVFVEFSPCTHSICELHCDSTGLPRKPFVSALVGVWCTLLCVGTGLPDFDCFVYLGIRLWVMSVRPMRGAGNKYERKYCIGRIVTPGPTKPCGRGDHHRDEKSERESERG